MTPPPFSRFWSARHLGPGGADVTVEANAAEREALAREIDLPAIDSLVGRFRLQGSPDRVQVTGEVVAEIVQTCVVTLDPFPAHVETPVDAAFREPTEAEESWEDVPGAEFEADLDRPDDLVGGGIDLGALAAEFLALGLDPYPRKPGAALDPALATEADSSPFAVLAGLPKPEGG